MEAIEFKASVEDGVIRVPAEYQSRFTKPVRVILLAEESTDGKNMIDRLLRNPRRVKDFKPLSRREIYE
jgi:hypothetical protein